MVKETSCRVRDGRGSVKRKVEGRNVVDGWHFSKGKG